MIRIAAVADVHALAGMEAHFAAQFAGIQEHADVLLIAGDLTKRGTQEEIRVLAGALAGVTIPVVAVLGNHDYFGGAEQELIRVMEEEAGARVLQDASLTLEVGGRTLGIAGSIGAEGGFLEQARWVRPAGAHLTTTGPGVAATLRENLQALRTDYRVALLHYAPVPGTLAGEPAELFPVLGSYLLGEAIDAAGADLVLHGHAHHGTEIGRTAGGIPVRNVAQHVLDAPYRVYLLPFSPEEAAEASAPVQDAEQPRLP